MLKKKITVLVIGGSGFLGSHVVDVLIKKNYKVIVYDKKKSKWFNKKQKYVKGSLENQSLLEKQIKKSQYVYNFAGVGDLDYGSNNPLKTIKSNIYLNSLICELCIKYKVKRFIYSSSIYVYSDKGSFYKSSKQAAESYMEEYSKKFNLKYTVLRFGSLYGPRSEMNNGLFKIISNYFKTGNLEYSGSRKTIREYIHVNDAAISCVDILKKKFENKHIILTGRERVLVKNILELLSRNLGYRGKIKYNNTKNINHYDVSPYTFQPKFGIKYYNKGMKSIQKEIINLLNYIKDV